MAAGRVRKLLSAAEIALGGAFLAVAAVGFVRVAILGPDRCPAGVHDCGSGMMVPFLSLIAAAWMIPSGLLLRQSEYVALFGHALLFCVMLALFG